MKKLFIFILIITSQFNLSAQKKIRKGNMPVVSVRNMDLSKTFVVRVDLELNGVVNVLVDKFLKSDTESSIENIWKDALFENGLEIGEYYSEKVAKDANNREILLKDKIIIEGDYLIDVNDMERIVVTDVHKSKVVATIRIPRFERKIPKPVYGISSSLIVSKAIEMMVEKAE